MAQKETGCYQYGKTRTRDGQHLKFSCPCKKVDEVRAFFQDNVCSVEIPVTHRTNVTHGGYGAYSRYEITQHKYAGGNNEGGGGFIEVLEIENPPEGRCGAVLHENCVNSYQPFALTHYFCEWKTVKDAKNAYNKNWSLKDGPNKFKGLKGFIRRVDCGLLRPWFYAIGNEELIGDYAFPEGLQDDPVFRFGRQFVVFDSEDMPEIKICMGTRFIFQGKDPHTGEEKTFRLVYWNDGSVWDERENRNIPRPAEEGELWIAEAIQQFKQILAGNNTTLTINFLNGEKFVGRLIQSKEKRHFHAAEGDYFLKVKFKDEKKPHQGWMNNFIPTPEQPHIISRLMAEAKARGKKVEKAEVLERKTKKGSKKWTGVFFSRRS
jgi:hypothetical protein